MFLFLFIIVRHFLYHHTGKLKKFRKLSESCDSASKPSTPTNELSSPLSQSLPSGGLSGMKRKKGASANYDIDNIVIPYSIASSTRVERIQYKEIPTPGWRTANDNINNDEADMDVSILKLISLCLFLSSKRFLTQFTLVAIKIKKGTLFRKIVKLNTIFLRYLKP